MRILVVYFWCQKLEYNHSLHVTKCTQLGGQGGRYLGNILTIKRYATVFGKFQIIDIALKYVQRHIYLMSIFFYILLKHILSLPCYCSLFGVEFTLPLLCEDKVILFCIINDIADRGEGKYEESRKEYDTKFP